MTTSSFDNKESFLIDQTRLHHLQERFPFRQDELEILVRCHEQQQQQQDDSFLVRLATASPYAVFFLPNYTAKDRVTWLEEHILPSGFAHLLQQTILLSLVGVQQDPSLEQFLEGICKTTGRRGAKEALRVFYQCCEGSIDPEAAVADLAVRLMVANQLWTSPGVPEEEHEAALLLSQEYPLIVRLTHNLRQYTNAHHTSNNSSHSTTLTEQLFLEWTEEQFPMLYQSLSTLINNLLFHGISTTTTSICPQTNVPSEILLNHHDPLAMSLAWMDSRLTGKFHRLYSSFHDGRSFNRLEYGILGYEGPTCTLILTTNNAVLGAFANTRWKACRGGGNQTDEAFLFALQPLLNVYHLRSTKKNVWYLYSQELASSGHLKFTEGLGWGGTHELPRLFIPAEFANCHAGGWDQTYQLGPLLPDECCERFEIKCLEVWAVGDEIEQGLAKQTQVRQQTAVALEQARVVHDKREFVGDLQRMPLTKVFQHQAEARGRHEFILDEKHGGYKIADG